MMTTAQRIEEYNYWNDSRTINSMVRRSQLEQLDRVSRDGRSVQVAIPTEHWEDCEFTDPDEIDEQGRSLCYVYKANPFGFGNRRRWTPAGYVPEDLEIEVLRTVVRWIDVPMRYEVCPECEGSGTEVDPAIDCGGLTAQDFAEDPDFAESYFAGHYDRPCSHCRGKRVVDVPDLSYLSPEDRERRERIINDWYRDQYDSAREIAAERAMGA